MRVEFAGKNATEHEIGMVYWGVQGVHPPRPSQVGCRGVQLIRRKNIRNIMKYT